MAVTVTTRMGVTRWSAGTDPFTRQHMDDSHASIESLAARDEQGTLAARPAAGIRGRYYFATDNGRLYRDTGTAWTEATMGPGKVYAAATDVVEDQAVTGDSQVRHDRLADGRLRWGPGNAALDAVLRRISASRMVFENLAASAGIDLGLATLSDYGNSDRTVRWGTGSPESVVTANVGSLFLRRDGVAGTIIYWKVTGAGNTGWQALARTRYIFIPPAAMILDAATNSTLAGGGTPWKTATVACADAATQGMLFVVEGDGGAGNTGFGSPSLKLLFSPSVSSNNFRIQVGGNIVTPSTSVVGDTGGQTTNSIAAGTANTIYKSADLWSAFGNWHADGQVTRYAVYRLGADAADTNTGILRILGVELAYTSEA